MDTEVRQNHELRADLEESQRELRAARIELARLTKKAEADAHYERLALMTETPQVRLSMLCETLMMLWMHCVEDAEVAKRMNDPGTEEIYRTIAAVISPSIQQLRDAGLGKLPARSLTTAVTG